MLFGPLPNGPADRDWSGRDPDKPMTREEFREYSGLNKIRKKRGQSPTNALTKAIKKYTDSHHKCHLYRINTTGIYDANLGMYRTSGSAKGIPDLVGLLLGRFFSVEVKIGRDVQSNVQKKRQAEIEYCGGIYYIARSFDEFKKFFDAAYKSSSTL